MALQGAVMPDEGVDEILRDLIVLCGQMLELADRGDAERTDAGCGVIYGTLRDEAYKIRRMAKNEPQKHIACTGVKYSMCSRKSRRAATVAKGLEV